LFDGMGEAPGDREEATAPTDPIAAVCGKTCRSHSLPGAFEGTDGFAQGLLMAGGGSARAC